MSDSGDQRDFLRWQGQIEERVNNKANRSDLSDLYTQNIEEVRRAEQRSRELVAKTAEDFKDDVSSLSRQVAQNGRGSQEIRAELHTFIQAQKVSNQGTLEALAGIQAKLEERKIDWQKWIQTGVLIVAVIMMIITQSWADLLKVRF